MSSETLNMSADQPSRGLNLGLSPRSPYSKSSRSPSPYSSSSNSNLGDREGNSYPDINVLEYCISEGSPVDTYHTTLPEGDLISPVSMNLNQTFIATPVDGSMNFWNENLSLMHDQETWLAKYPTFTKNTADGSNSLVMSPDSSGRESQLSSCEISRRGSLDNGNYSLSSGEMVIRSNSFCLEDQSILVVSSLDETSISPAVGHPALPVSSNLLSTTLPDVCEKSTERLVEKNLGHPFLGMTFIQTENWEFPTEENEKTSSLATLPNENEMGLLKTFVCETSSEDSGKEAKFPSEADLLHRFPRAITPEQGKTFVSSLSTMQETNNDIHTSTPLQITGNKIPSLPSFTESPFTGNLSSPGPNTVTQQPVSLTPKGNVVAGLEVLQINRTSNLDTSGIEYKVVTGTRPQMTVPSPVSQFKRSQLRVNNKHTDTKKGSTMGISPTKVSNNKMVSSGQLHKVVGNVDMIQLSEHSAVELHDQRLSPLNHHAASNTHNLTIKCCDTRSEVAQDASETHAGNQTFCYTSLEKSPDRSGQTNFKPTLKEVMSEKIEVKSRSALGQHKPPVLKTRLRFSSDSSSSRPTKEKRITPSFTIPKGDIHPSQTRAGNLNCSSQNKKPIQTEASNKPTKNSSREVKKISLVTESSKPASQGASWNDSKSKLRGGKKETPLSQSLAANPRPATLSARLKQGILGRDDCKISRPIRTPQSKLKNTTGSQRVQATGEPTFRNGSAAITKHQLNGSQPPQTPTRSSFMGPPPTPSSKIPRKTPRILRTPAEAGAHRETSDSTRSSQVSGGTANKPTPLKSVFKARNISTPGKSTQPTLTLACKPVASTSKQVSSSTVSPLLKTSAKFIHPPLCVDKIKSKASSCQQRHQQQATQSNQSNGPPDVVPASVAEVERKNHKIQQLKGLLSANNCRFEAITIVLQQTLAKSDEATRQCRELSQELVNLRGELVCSERLEKEKEELRVTLEDALKKLQEQHQKDLTELEQSLQAFYQEEWDKVHLTYQKEADKCKTLMQQQMGELISSHEAIKFELQTRHDEQLQSVKQQYEMSLQELRKAHSDELQSMENSLKHTEASLSGQIQELTVENNALIEKLTADENVRKEIAEKSQKDSHTLYLEQELESLKVVLDIKNKQLHQQEKKLVELDKLTEKNVKLDESLKKVQQENEDLKARMERHAALSRQLSTEQAVLQESLQKESKVNKRLSMENEELLWKLHNGDLSSPRKVSPTSTSPLQSPSHSFTLQSPHSPSVFSGSPLSPR